MKKFWKKIWKTLESSWEVGVEVGAAIGEKLAPVFGPVFAYLTAILTTIAFAPFVIVLKKRADVTKYISFWKKAVYYICAIMIGVFCVACCVLVLLAPLALVGACGFLTYLIISKLVEMYTAVVVIAAAIVAGSILYALAVAIDTLVRKIKKLKTPRRPFQYSR